MLKIQDLAGKILKIHNLATHHMITHSRNSRRITYRIGAPLAEREMWLILISLLARNELQIARSRNLASKYKANNVIEDCLNNCDLKELATIHASIK